MVRAVAMVIGNDVTGLTRKGSSRDVVYSQRRLRAPLILADVAVK